MATFTEFLEEADEIFGFCFDVEMACSLAKSRLEAIQRMTKNSDEAPFSFRDGPPQGSPEQEIEESLHSTTIGALKDRLSDGGFDQKKAASATIVFVFQIWEDKYRRNIVGSDGKVMEAIDSDIMGDLRLLRNSIIHNKGIAMGNVASCKVITRFKPGDKIDLTKSDIYDIISAIRSEFAVSHKSPT